MTDADPARHSRRPSILPARHGHRGTAGRWSAWLHPYVFLAMAAGWLLIGDLPTRATVDGMTVSAGLTLVTSALVAAAAVATGVRWLLRHGVERALAAVSTVFGAGLTCLLLFLAWGYIRLLSGPTSQGVQNMAVYTAFVGGVVWTYLSRSRAMPSSVLHVTTIVSVIATSLLLLSLVLDVEIYDGRAFGLLGLAFVPVLVSSRSERRWLRAAPFVAVVVIALSLSRTATVIAAGLLAFLVVRGQREGRLRRGLRIVAAALVVVVLAIVSFPPLRHRFTTGDNAVSIGGLRFNTSGRTQIWSVVWDSAIKSPIIGHGPGSAVAEVSSHFEFISQPHDEFLRQFHDFGVIGLLLFVAGQVLLLVNAARRAHRLDRPIDWAATMVLLAVLGVALTDNVFIYPFVMFTVAAIVGTAAAPQDAAEDAEPAGGAGHRGTAVGSTGRGTDA